MGTIHCAHYLKLTTYGPEITTLVLGRENRARIAPGARRLRHRD
jgi:hypothetical protein